MAVAFVGGAALGAAFGELLRVVVQETTEIVRFKTILQRLKETLESIQPVVEEITELNKVLNHREQRQTESFTAYLKNGSDLVRKCSKVKFWNLYDKFIYKNELIRLDGALVRFFQIEAQANLACNSMKTLIGVNSLNHKFDHAISANTIRAGGFSGSCSVPGLPDLIIGLNRHLQDLKRRLLTDDTRVLVISAPGGSGKTTVAKMLCHDDEIKGIFGHDILYVTVSRPSSLKAIAKKLYEHHGQSNCEFQTDEEAKNQIENLLKQLGSDKMLLVLDDVWPESESLIQDLKFSISGYKILVTSRFSFPRFKSTYELTLLNDEDSKILFCHSAFPSDGIPVNVPDDLVNKMVKYCKGLPLALTVVGASLCNQHVVKWKSTIKKWSEGHQTIFQSNRNLLLSLQTSIDALDELPIVKECFLDFGSFPEDDKIAGITLEDMWVELYDLDDEGMYASENLLELASRNLITLVPIRKDAGEVEGYCNEHYVTQHDLLRELAIYLSSQGTVAERKRLYMEINGNNFPKWWIQQIEQPNNARVLSISTDNEFSSNWLDLNAPKVEVLILNTRSKNYALPQFITKMSQMKVLIVTGYGDYPTQLQNLQFIASLHSLKRIRFEHVSISTAIQHIFTLQNLQKLTFVTCQIGNALNTCTIEYPYKLLPNLTDLEIDRCYDLKQLPEGLLCSLIRLQKLIITNCHELDVLPRGLGGLTNLETLRLRCCTKLQELPESIGSLRDLRLVDISDCLSISVLPEQFGELSGLRVINMSGCRGLQDLPVSVSRLLQLKDVICDEETSYLWNDVASANVKINLVEDDRFGSFMKIY